MNEFFLKLINASISASWLIGAVLILRLVLRKAPKWIYVLLWGIVAVRLICPFSIESALSLIPSAETIPLDIEMDSTPAIDSGIYAVNQLINPAISASFTPQPAASANPLQIWISVASNVWVVGVAALLIYTVISCWCLHRKVATAVCYRDNIFQSENVGSPFVLGVIKPRIYLPFKISDADLESVIAHEQAHISRKDHWWKPLGFLLMAIHWFNPFAWIAYVVLCRDIELACDERVIKDLDNDKKADYTQALVSVGVNRRSIAACPLAFGEVGVKARVKSIMKYKKPTFCIIALAAIVCAIVMVCFLTNPRDNAPDLSFLNYENAITRVADRDEVPVIHYPSSEDEGASIVLGVASGRDLAKQLDTWVWKESTAPRQSLPSPGSVEFIIDDDYRITVHQKKTGALRQYAVVKYQDEVRYYKVNPSDYQDALALVYPEPVRRARLQATVVDIRDGYFLVDPADGNSTEWIEVPMANMDPALEPQIGDVIEIIHSGEILETAPGRLTEVYSIKVITETKRLSLNDVILLSQYGYDLSWEDFEQFDYTEAGFGLYIRIYEINDRYKLQIGGAGPDSEPMYISLVKDDADRIDIRDGGVTEFIEGNQPLAAVSEDEPLMIHYVENEGGSIKITPRYYENGFNWNYEQLTQHEIQNSGKLIFTANWNTEELVISENYYERTGVDSVFIHRNTYTLERNTNGSFVLDVVYKNPGENESVVYFIQGNKGKYVMKITFDPIDKTQFAETIDKE